MMCAERSRFFLYRLHLADENTLIWLVTQSRVGRPLENLVTGQSSAICIIVCCGVIQPYPLAADHRSNLLCNTVTTSWICDLLPAGKAVQLRT